MVSFGYGKAKRYDATIDADWIQWIESKLHMLKNNGCLGFPLRGLVYRIDKVNKIATLTVVANPALNSETKTITERILTLHLGYTVKMDKNAVKNTVDEFAEALETKMPLEKKYLSDQKCCKLKIYSD